MSHRYSPPPSPAPWVSSTRAMGSDFPQTLSMWPFHILCTTTETLAHRDALEGKGPQRRSGRRLEEVVQAVGGGYSRLRMPLKLALGVRGIVAGHRLGALEGGGGGLPPPIPMLAQREEHVMPPAPRAQATR